MKKIFSFSFLLLLLGTNLVFGQEESTVLKLGEDKLYSYEKVFEVPGKSKDEIFESIKHWVISNIKSQANTNYFDEKKNSITTTPAFPCSFDSWIEFKINIDIKDGKYRLTASSFIWHNMQGVAKTFGDYSEWHYKKKDREKIMGDVDEHFTKMIGSIQKSTEKSSDW